VGTVSGTVEPLQWAPEVEVCLVEARPPETCTAPAADGTYTLEVPFGEVQIEFVPSIRSGLLRQYYDHQSNLAGATKIPISPFHLIASGIDADLVEGGAIEGTVSAAQTGLPLGEVEVCAVSAGSAPVRRCGETDASGAYELHGLPGASYTMSFHGRGASAAYAPSLPATPVSVSAGTTSTGIDATLEKGAEIEGFVSEAGGGSLPGIDVCLFGAGAASPERCTYSETGGSYSFAGLPGGSYEVGFSLEGDGFASQYFDGVSSRTEAAQIIATAPSVNSGVNAALSRPPVPPAPLPPPAVSAPILAAAAFVPEPAAPKRCKRGYRKKKVKGKTRCVKAHKAKAKKGKRR
jgi:hypothetical protein